MAIRVCPVTPVNQATVVTLVSVPLVILATQAYQVTQVIPGSAGIALFLAIRDLVPFPDILDTVQFLDIQVIVGFRGIVGILGCRAIQDTQEKAATVPFPATLGMAGRVIQVTEGQDIVDIRGFPDILQSQDIAATPAFRVIAVILVGVGIVPTQDTRVIPVGLGTQATLAIVDTPADQVILLYQAIRAIVVLADIVDIPALEHPAILDIVV